MRGSGARRISGLEPPRRGLHTFLGHGPGSALNMQLQKRSCADLKLPNPGGLRNNPSPTNPDGIWTSCAFPSRIRSPKHIACCRVRSKTAPAFFDLPHEGEERKGLPPIHPPASESLEPLARYLTGRKSGISLSKLSGRSYPLTAELIRNLLT